MAYPKPEPGLVIGYSYLWHSEKERGYEDGFKDRPCAIVLAAEDNDGNTRMTVVPITHTEPANLDEAVEIPPATKQRLRLDDERSWVIVSEVNQFVWPGPDLRPVSRQQPDQYAYGMLPPQLFEQIKDRLLNLIEKQRISSVERTDM